MFKLCITSPVFFSSGNKHKTIYAAIVAIVSKTAIHCQVYCSTKPFSHRFPSLKSSTSLEVCFQYTHFFQTAWEITQLFSLPFHMHIFFHDYSTQNLFWNLKSSSNSFHTHHQPLQYSQQLHSAERPESHCACNFLKAEGVYCCGFYLRL